MCVVERDVIETYREPSHSYPIRSLTHSNLSADPIPHTYPYGPPVQRHPRNSPTLRRHCVLRVHPYKSTDPPLTNLTHNHTAHPRRSLAHPFGSPIHCTATCPAASPCSSRGCAASKILPPARCRAPLSRPALIVFLLPSPPSWPMFCSLIVGGPNFLVPSPHFYPESVVCYGRIDTQLSLLSLTPHPHCDFARISGGGAPRVLRGRGRGDAARLAGPPRHQPRRCARPQIDGPISRPCVCVVCVLSVVCHVFTHNTHNAHNTNYALTLTHTITPLTQHTHTISKPRASPCALPSRPNLIRRQHQRQRQQHQ